MAKRYFEYEQIAQNFEDWMDGYKPAGTLGRHKIEKIVKKDDGFEVFSNQSIPEHAKNSGWKNRVFVQPGQILIYDCGYLRAKRPSKLGQFKIKIQKFDIGDTIVSHSLNSFQSTGVCNIAGDSEYFCKPVGEWYNVYNSRRNDGEDGYVAKTAGLFLVKNSYRQRGFGDNSTYFALVGNYRVTDADIEKIKRSLSVF